MFEISTFPIWNRNTVYLRMHRHKKKKQIQTKFPKATSDSLNPALVTQTLCLKTDVTKKNISCRDEIRAQLCVEFSELFPALPLFLRLLHSRAIPSSISRSNMCVHVWFSRTFFLIIKLSAKINGFWHANRKKKERAIVFAIFFIICCAVHFHWIFFLRFSSSFPRSEFNLFT